MTLRAPAGKVGGGQAELCPQRPAARHEMQVGGVSGPSLARLDLPPLAVVKDRPRERREQPPVVRQDSLISRLLRPPPQMHGEFRAPALKLPLVKQAKSG